MPFFSGYEAYGSIIDFGNARLDFLKQIRWFLVRYSIGDMLSRVLRMINDKTLSGSYER